MNPKRTPRHKRTSGRAVLTARDEAVLRMINRFRIARTSDVRRILFTGRSGGRTAERLRQLFRAGYLDVRVGRLSEENVYSLGPAGRRWIESAEVGVGRLPSGSLEHHLAIVSVWTRLAAAVQQRSPLRLQLFRPDWEIREHQSRLRLPVVPDAVAELTAGGKTVRLALEVDRGTERHFAIRKKLEAYRQLRWRVKEEWGWLELRLVVLVWAEGERRQASLRRLIEQSGSSEASVCSKEDWPERFLSGLQPPLTNPANSRRVDERASDADSISSTTVEAGLSQKRLAGSVGT